MSGPRSETGGDRWAAGPWLAWGLAASFYLYGFFLRVSPSVMVDELMRDFAASAAITGTLSALYFYAYAGLQIPVGLMLDTWGPRRMLSIAAVACGAGSLLFAVAPTIEIAYLGRLLIGAGAAFTWVGTLSVAASGLPRERFAGVSGLTLACGMAGAVAGQAPLALSVAAFGWRPTLAVAGLAGALLAVALARVLPPHRPAATGERGGWRLLVRGLRLAVRQRQTWLMAAFGACMSVPALTFGALWGVPFLETAYGLDRSAAALVTSAMLVAWGLGSVAVGWLSDRLGRRRLPMTLSAIASAACFTWAFAEPAHGVAAFAALVVIGGLVAGGMVIAFAAGREHAPPAATGAVMGVINTGVMLVGGAIMQPLIGWMLDRQWDGTLLDGRPVYAADAYRDAFLTIPLLLAVAALAAALSRDRPSG